MRAVEIFLVFATLLIFCRSFHKLSYMASSNQLHFSHQMSKSEEDTTYLVEKMAKKMEKLILENAELKRLASATVAIKYPALPEWFVELKSHADCCLVDDYVREWNDESWRTSAGGFSGTDYVHSRSSAPARVLEYLIVKRAILGDDNTKDMNEGVFYPSLVGPAYFSAAAESHKGLCHGGSMCALMDDAIGWMGFCISGKPREWTGYTVQIDTSLKKSVPVGSTLKLESWVERREGSRKIWICAKLTDPKDNTEYCTSRGLFLLSPEALVSNNELSSVDDMNNKSKL